MRTTDTFSALSEPNRFQIVELLATGPHSVNEISTLLKFDQPKTSKHLRVLADAGVVEVKAIAQKRIYQVNTKSLREIESWAAKMNAMWNEKFIKLDRVLEEMKND